MAVWVGFVHGARRGCLLAEAVLSGVLVSEAVFRARANTTVDVPYCTYRYVPVLDLDLVRGELIRASFFVYFRLCLLSFNKPRSLVDLHVVPHMLGIPTHLI